MFVLERSPPPSSDMANHVSEEEPVAVERAAEEPVAVERAAEEQQEWAHRRWPKPRETETPVGAGAGEGWVLVLLDRCGPGLG
eukprot:s5937_g1.t2